MTEIYFAPIISWEQYRKEIHTIKDRDKCVVYEVLIRDSEELAHPFRYDPEFPNDRYSEAFSDWFNCVNNYYKKSKLQFEIAEIALTRMILTEKKIFEENNALIN